SELRELAPTGVLRLGLIYTNMNIASCPTRVGPEPCPPTGELQGVGVDLGRELADRLGLSFEPVGYRTGPEAEDGLRTGQVEAAILTVDPVRAAEFDFSSAYLVDDQTYIVRADSPIRTAADADRPGVRIAATPGSAFALVLQRELRNAELV